MRRLIGPDRITLWGNSLGTGVATEMAFRGHGSRLILQAPFTSIPDVAMTVAPFLPLRAIMKDRFASLEKAPFIQLPTLIVHGDADGVVPYRMGRRLSERFAHATLHTVPGGGHSDLYLRDPTLLDRIAAFAAATDG